MVNLTRVLLGHEERKTRKPREVLLYLSKNMKFDARNFSCRFGHVGMDTTIRGRKR
jgi:hypothetical protein